MTIFKENEGNDGNKDKANVKKFQRSKKGRKPSGGKAKRSNGNKNVSINEKTLGKKRGRLGNESSRLGGKNFNKKPQKNSSCVLEEVIKEQRIPPTGGEITILEKREDEVDELNISEISVEEIKNHSIEMPCMELTTVGSFQVGKTVYFRFRVFWWMTVFCVFQELSPENEPKVSYFPLDCKTWPLALWSVKDRVVILENLHPLVDEELLRKKIQVQCIGREDLVRKLYAHIFGSFLN